MTKKTLKTKEYNWEEWQLLNEVERRNTYNHVWDAFNPEIGKKTKKAIIDNFISHLNIDAIQYGIKSFGWNVYMLYVIVKDSKDRIPKSFGGMSVNKGLVIEKLNSEKAIVKFSYGGKVEVELTQRIVIK